MDDGRTRAACAGGGRVVVRWGGRGGRAISWRAPSARKVDRQMAKRQMVINYVPGEECRVAVIEGGKLEEFHSERADSTSHVRPWLAMTSLAS